MSGRSIAVLLAGFFAAMFAVEAATQHRLVAYWGQNGVYGRKKDKQYWEKNLKHFCQNSKYDVIVLSFLHVFFERGNKDQMPRFNFAYHCETPLSTDYPFLLRCPHIEEGVKECHKNGKKVLMSLGGAVGPYGFQTNDEAKLFAYRVWHLLLEGRDLQNLRPFGTAILDGVDLDIEGGSPFGYTTFVKELRHLEKTLGTGKKRYIIAAAPQCPYPDGHLGPQPGKALGDVPEMFDEIYIQFYNNWCHTGDEKVFNENVKQWLSYSTNSKGPLIFVGVPADRGGSGNDANYRPPQELAGIYAKLKKEPRFGGFMLWDAGFDQNNVINGKIYSEHIADMFNNRPPATGHPHTLHPVTSAPGTQKPPVPGTTHKPVKTLPPTKPTSVSCKGLSSGMYPHPTDCTKFFVCHEGTAHVNSCPAGLHFNPTAKLCDWPENAKC